MRMMFNSRDDFFKHKKLVKTDNFGKQSIVFTDSKKE